ncbi:MAG: PilZ domain-containing protein [Alphaproteobacteria bacterium]|nr:MAG: PilZ domain-containing protein [Alphaproteobacteria bacterium]
MSASSQITQKRLEKRWAVDKSGFFLRTGSNIPEACRILDWSARGAKVKMPKGAVLPDEFILSIDFGKSIIGTARCHKVWSSGTITGVQFDEELKFDVDTRSKSKGPPREAVWRHLLEQKQPEAFEDSNNDDGSHGRHFHRLRTLKSGQLIYPGGLGSWDCTIRDLTPLGARLRFSEPYNGPNQIILRIGLGELRTAEVPGKVAWRRGNDVGIAFDQEIPL